MFDVENMYDDIIADSYDADQFQLLTKAREVALGQMRRHAGDQDYAAIIDLALGTGEILLELQKMFPDARFSGIDISKRMIDIARSKMEIDTFHDDLRNVGNHVSPGSFDLALLHFVLTYVDTEQTLADAARTLRPGGLCSIATSTYDSFKVLQGLARHVMTPDEVKRLADLPENPDALEQLLRQAGFEVLEKHVLVEKVGFGDFHALRQWGTHSGWLTQYFTRITDDQAEMLSAIGGIFPLEDEFQGTILLLRKL